MKSFLFGALWVFVAAFIALGSYMLKNHVIFLEKDIRKTNRQIAANIRETHILKAEWSHLNDPSRIRRLSEKYLKLSPITAEQFIDIDNIPFEKENNKEKEQKQ